MTTATPPPHAQLQREIENRLTAAITNYALALKEQQSRCDQTPNHPELGHLHEQISAEAFLLAEQKVGPAPLVAALQSMGLTGLCPTAAEAHYHAIEQKSRDDLLSLLTESCPIFVQKKILFAAPAGPLDATALQRISDRILSTLNESKCKKVQLLLLGLDAPPAVQSQWLSFLKEDLTALKIGLTLPK